jgi:hypothetical protein
VNRNDLDAQIKNKEKKEKAPTKNLMKQQCLLNIHAFDPTAHHARFCINYANQCRRLMADAFFFLAIVS